MSAKTIRYNGYVIAVGQLASGSWKASFQSIDGTPIEVKGFKRVSWDTMLCATEQLAVDHAKAAIEAI
jgi:hypothetical protein